MILLAVRWYPRSGLSYRDVEELLAERGIEVDHVTIWWVQVLHDTTQYANNRIEWDHGRLEARRRPMRGLRTDRTASTVIRGHTFVQNLRHGHYERGIEAPPRTSTRRRLR